MWRAVLVFIAFDIGLRAASGFGLTAWREWPPGDAHDVGFLCGLVVFLLTQPRKQPAT